MATEEFIQNITALGLIALFLIIVVKPLMVVFLRRLQDKINGTNGYSRLEKKWSELQEEVEQLSNNHLGDIERRIAELENMAKEASKEREEIKIRLVKLEAKINGFYQK